MNPGTSLPESEMAERRRVEQALQESEQRFRQLFKDSRQAMVLLEGDRIVDGNTAAVALLRLDSIEQLIGSTPVDFSNPVQPDGRPSAELAALSGASHSLQ